MTKNKRSRLFEHPMIFGSHVSWLKLMWTTRDIDVKFLPRALFVTLSTCATSPLRMYESARYSRKVANTPVHRSPIYIIGHWRTGTTHLHNLLCQDRNFAHVSTFQAFAPGMCLIGAKIVKRPLDWFAKKLHSTREIDNIPLSMDNPEEEDLAIANMSPYSYLHMYSFPRQARYFFDRYISYFDGLPDSTIAEWKEYYMTMLRKASLACGGKRLVIKNCADSARLRTVLELFPDAKFIHIYRNPYNVFRSTRFLYETVLARSQVQKFSLKELDNWVVLFYSQLMQRFLADKALIPAGNLVELSYEDLETAPLREMRRVYETLGLPGFSEVEPAIKAYIDSIAGYTKNPQAFDDDVISKVNKHWQFALDALGYERLEPGAGKA